MNCLKPIQLKSGLVVPCGNCLLCQSSKRTEKSVLVQLHCEQFDRMPLFIGLSYDDEHLPYYCTCPTEERLDGARAWSPLRYYRKHDLDELHLKCTVPSLFRRDVSSFLKSYKRSFSLTNDKFTYFGCGEYGDSYDRPHYHLIVFGDSTLERMFDCSVHAAENWLSEFWSNGHVDINIAEWSGIHYVTKYCMKDNQETPPGALPPFTISGKGIGLGWLKSLEAERIRQQLLYCQFNKEKIYADIYIMELDFSDPRQVKKLTTQWIDYLRPFMPNFEVRLPSGKKAMLPRKLKRRLLGSFQHFSDNPLWVYDWLLELRETAQYYLDNEGLSIQKAFDLSTQALEQKAYSIQQRINRYKKPLR